MVTALRIIGPFYRGVWICIAGLRDLQTPSFEIPWFLGWGYFTPTSRSYNFLLKTGSGASYLVPLDTLVECFWNQIWAHNAKLTWTNIPIGVWYVYLQLVDSFGTCRQLYHTLVLWDINIYSILKMYSIFADSINETTSPCKVIGHFIQPILKSWLLSFQNHPSVLRVFAIFSTVFFCALQNAAKATKAKLISKTIHPGQSECFGSWMKKRNN